MSVPTTRPEGANPLAEDPKPTQRSAADVQGASAGSAVERREELPPGGLPHARLQPQALQLRWLVSQQVLLRHRPQYLPSSRGTARHPSCPVERVPSTEPAARWPRRRERSTRAPRPHDTGEATKSHGRLDHPSGGPASLFLLWTSESEGWPPDTPARDDEREPRSRLLLHDETEHSEGAPRPTASLLRVWETGDASAARRGPATRQRSSPSGTDPALGREVAASTRSRAGHAGSPPPRSARSARRPQPGAQRGTGPPDR
jgi:hypothetical protein